MSTGSCFFRSDRIAVRATMRGAPAFSQAASVIKVTVALRTVKVKVLDSYRPTAPQSAAM